MTISTIAKCPKCGTDIHVMAEATGPGGLCLDCAIIAEGARAMGRLGGSKTSAAKVKASRENGRLGGRPPVSVRLINHEGHVWEWPSMREARPHLRKSRLRDYKIIDGVRVYNDREE